MLDGARHKTSFPSVSYSPEATQWWDNAKNVPGWEKGSNCSGYETTYDRLRVLSSVPILQPLYNHDHKREYTEGLYIAMEDDGLTIGYAGCESMAAVAQWQASAENGAPSLRPEL